MLKIIAFFLYVTKTKTILYQCCQQCVESVNTLGEPRTTFRFTGFFNYNTIPYVPECFLIVFGLVSTVITILFIPQQHRLTNLNTMNDRGMRTELATDALLLRNNVLLFLVGLQTLLKRPMHISFKKPFFSFGLLKVSQKQSAINATTCRGISVITIVCSKVQG